MTIKKFHFMLGMFASVITIISAGLWIVSDESKVGLASDLNIEGQTYDPRIIGSWVSDYSYPISDGRADIYGETEYFQNGNYTFQGNVKYVGYYESEFVEVVYYVLLSGEWQNINSSLIHELIDMKSKVNAVKSTSLHLSSKELDAIEGLFGIKFPNIEDIFPAGFTNTIKIIRLDDGRMRIRDIDPSKKPFEYISVKQLS